MLVGLVAPNRVLIAFAVVCAFVAVVCALVAVVWAVATAVCSAVSPAALPVSAHALHAVGVLLERLRKNLTTPFPATPLQQVNSCKTPLLCIEEILRIARELLLLKRVKSGRLSEAITEYCVLVNRYVPGVTRSLKSAGHASAPDVVLGKFKVAYIRLALPALRPLVFAFSGVAKTVVMFGTAV